MTAKIFSFFDRVQRIFQGGFELVYIISAGTYFTYENVLGKIFINFYQMIFFLYSFFFLFYFYSR